MDEKIRSALRQGVRAFLGWFVLGAIAILWISGQRVLPTYIEMALLCGLNLFSLGKVFANLAGVVSSVDPIKKNTLRVRVALWGGVKLASLLGVVLMLWYKRQDNEEAIVLGISGWVIVPFLMGWLIRNPSKK